MNEVYKKNKQIIDSMKHVEEELGIKFTQIHYTDLKSGSDNIILENELRGAFRYFGISEEEDE